VETVAYEPSPRDIAVEEDRGNAKRTENGVKKSALLLLHRSKEEKKKGKGDPSRGGWGRDWESGVEHESQRIGKTPSEVDSRTGSRGEKVAERKKHSPHRKKHLNADLHATTERGGPGARNAVQWGRGGRVKGGR